MVPSSSTTKICKAQGALQRLSHRTLGLPRSLSSHALKPRLIAPGAIRSFSCLSSLGFVSTGVWDAHCVRKHHGNRLSSTLSTSSKKAAVFALVNRIHEHHYGLLEDVDDLELLQQFPGLSEFFELRLADEFTSILGHLNEETLRERVRLARQEHGDSLPEGELNEEEMTLYTRLYGAPVASSGNEVMVEEENGNQLFRDDGQGGLVEVDLEMKVEDEIEDAPPQREAGTETFDLEDLESRTREVAAQFEGEVVSDFVEDDHSHNKKKLRTHPLTAAARGNTFPSTVAMPQSTAVGPIQAILSQYRQKHITKAANGLFGEGLAKSTSTTKPPPQVPIPLSAAQRGMTEMEATTFLSVLYPGTYAMTLSILTEIRKRLGTKWLRDLIDQEGGPRVLDAGGGGANILAWREVLKAEWFSMYLDHPTESPAPQGKATVLTGADTLRHRASKLLDNTTFIPRIPDYLHLRDPSTVSDGELPPNRKQFDVIIASHNLMHFSEDYMRKEYVQNLWSLLNPNGGVLILVEKGMQRGFDAIVGAREMILKRLIASPGSTQHGTTLDSSDEDNTAQKERGMIIAPCTNHTKCPMYGIPGTYTSGRDFCRFSQRYIRPNFLQAITGEANRNYEDVQFSYLAVQRGVDQRESQGIIQGEGAADAAFSGYEASLDNAGNFRIQDPSEMDQSTAPELNNLSLPRLILAPLKRKGHVTMDLCTPAGKIERWTVPRSFSKQAYRDARKSAWGDLWALGAKTRVLRSLRLGEKKKDKPKSKGSAKASRLRDKEADEEEEDELGATQPNSMSESAVDIPDFERIMEKFEDERRPKGSKHRKSDKNSPAWAKKMQKRLARGDTKDVAKSRQQKPWAKSRNS